MVVKKKSVKRSKRPAADAGVKPDAGKKQLSPKKRAWRAIRRLEALDKDAAARRKHAYAEVATSGDEEKFLKLAKEVEAEIARLSKD